jgi:hypothetical protein
VSDANGLFSQCGLAGGNYDVVAGKWGYETFCDQVNISASNISIDLKPGIYDDFSFPFGWTTSGNASTGIWVRAIPSGSDYNGITANPDSDVNADCSDKAFVTGNNSTNASSDDVDNGETNLLSPLFDLSNYNAPQIRYARWFFNSGGSGNPNDSLIISISNGTQSVILETVTANSSNNSTWVQRSFDLAGVIPFTSTMQLKIHTADVQPGHLLEAGFDHFRIVELDAASINDHTASSAISVSPVPASSGESINFSSSLSEIQSLAIYDLSGRLVFSTPVQNAKQIKVQTALSSGSYLWNIIDVQGNSHQGKLMVR